MPISSPAHPMRDLLRQHQFKALFTQHLGWDNASDSPSISLDGHTFRFEAVAIKGGLPVFVCRVENLAALTRKTALDLDNLLAKVAAEHVIVWHDADSQLWQFSKREIGKANRFNRTAVLPDDHSFTDLLGRLDGLKVTLDQEIEAQERGGLGIIEIAGRINRNFNVDAVSAQFYSGFKAQRDSLLGFLEGVEGRVKDEYASLLLTRLMFLYFMQAKGFLRFKKGDADHKHYLRLAFEDESRRFGGKTDYYAGFLKPLFFEMLSKRPFERFPTDTPKFRDTIRVFGELIYLNGGLFAPRDFETIDKIRVDDLFFGGLFEFFDKWNWVLDDRPTRDGREINPDVLGYVFEKFINQKQMGAYYTKEDITGYIARNTILPFLFEKAAPNAERAFGLIAANPARYIYPAVKYGCDLPLPAEIEAGIADVSQRGGWNRTATSDLGLPTEIWREVVARRARYFALAGDRAGLAPSSNLSNSLAGERLEEGGSPALASNSIQITQIADLITHNLNIELWMADVIANLETEAEVWGFWQALEEVSILDPTVGSGAFLFAAMNILEPLYRELLSRMDEVVENFEALQKRNPNRLDQHISDFRATLDDIEKHSNRSYEICKKMMVRNLYGVDIMGEAVEVCKLRLFLKLASQASPDNALDNLGIEPLPDIDFNIRAGNTLVGFATKAEAHKASVEQLALGIGWSEVETEMRDYGTRFDQFHELQRRDGSVTPAVKAQLQQKHDSLVEKLDVLNAGQYGQMPLSDAKAYAAWRASHQPFHWCAEFYSILEGGGFDVIIGNPPYVEYAKVRADYTIRGYETLSCGNLYAFATERSFALADPKGYVALIVPLSIFCTPNMKLMQQLTKRTAAQSWISYYSNRPDQLFEGAQNFLSILISRVGRDTNPKFTYTTKLMRWASEMREQLFPMLEYAQVEWLSAMPDYAFPKFHSRIEEGIAEKVFSSNNKLSKNMNGVSTGKKKFTYCYGGVYWTKARNFESPIIKDGKIDISSADRPVFVVAPNASQIVCAGILNSSLHFWFWANFSDCRNKTYQVMLDLPIPNVEMLGDIEIEFAAKQLMRDYKTNSERKVRDGKGGRTEFDEFYPKKSKPIIDEIDRVLASHYGFSDEELDFIINYDIKYRMGQGAGDD